MSNQSSLSQDNEAETKAFLRAYDEYADAIFRYCLFKTNDRERAKDIVQDTFMRAWDYVAKDGNVAEWRPFLYKIARNLIIDSYRKKTSESLDALMEEGIKIADEHVDSNPERMAEILNATRLIKKLDKEYHDVVLMRYVEDLSPKEIAETLGESENAVSVRIHRGIKKLQQIVNIQDNQYNER